MGSSVEPASCLMVQGTGSYTGKSVITAALCRIFYRDGYRVAPFKAQNMSLNSFVTGEGGEMGRAQVLQAQAAGIEPHTDMNPILLKPSTDSKAQVVLEGRPVGHMDASRYQERKLEFLPVALQALDRLRGSFDVVVMEGAGSPAEINLMNSDIANMRMAEAAGAPVLLVGDIDLGGVFAALFGTVELLDPPERERVAGFIINKFRGSPELLGGGLELLEERTGIPTLGVVPYINDLGLEEEDSVGLPSGRNGSSNRAEIDIAVVSLPHISNFTDFDPLAGEPGVLLRYPGRPKDVGLPDALILPGSKSTIDDLEHLRRNGMDEVILDLANRGVPVIGICGGYQMLGREIHDPGCRESGRQKTRGLGLLPVRTRIMDEKSTHRVEVKARRSVPVLGIGPASPRLRGYEIHMGESKIEGRPVFSIVRLDSAGVAVQDGALHESLDVFGCYIHGLFENSVVREGFLNYLRERKGLSPSEVTTDWEEWREDRLDRLAGIVRSSVDMDVVYSLLDSRR